MMARLIFSVLALMVFLGFSQAFNISEFKTISSDVGVYDEWVKRDSNHAHSETEDFGLAFCIAKTYLVSRPNGTAVRGGIVSTLVDGKWQHGAFDQKLDDERFHDELFTMNGRLFMLTAGDMDGRIAFNTLYVWDLDNSKWVNVSLDIPDKDNAFQKLERGMKFISIDVPDQDSKIAYVVATDHDMANSDSSTTFSKLEIAFDQPMPASNPLNATLKFVNRIKSDHSKAVIASAIKDKRLYALVARFVKDAITAEISIDYAIDLLNNNSKVDGIKLEGAMMPKIDFAVGKDRIFQAKDMLLLLGPHKLDAQGSTATRHVWAIDLAQKKMQDVDAKFLDLPNRIFAIDQVEKRLVTADLKKGAFAAMINNP